MTLQTYYSILCLDHLHWKNAIYFCYVHCEFAKVCWHATTIRPASNIFRNFRNLVNIPFILEVLPLP